METPNTPVDAIDDAALEKEIQASLDSIKAEVGAPATPEPKAAETPEPKAPEVAAEPVSPAPEKTEPQTPATDPNAAPPKAEYKAPVKGKFESEESFQKRVELSELVKQRKEATTEEKKKELSDKIATTRKDLSNINNNDRINNLSNNGGKPEAPAPKSDEDLKKEADLARLKELGGATKEDIDAMLQERERAQNVQNVLENFISRHPELKDDEDVREVFFDFVDSNYKWDDKAGKDLMTVLELAHESMFKPSETIQERILEGAKVQEKVNAMQFPGGTVVKPGLTPEQQKSVDELKSTGMSEEKALELISDD